MLRWLPLLTGIAAPLAAQVDEQLAATYFEEAQRLCQREGGRLWGVSLCGPMVFADAATQTIATNQPPPEADRPRMLGFANTAIRWGDERWSTVVWRFLPADDERRRAEVMMHELFHRVQFDLGLMTTQGMNDHLDTLKGRYWLQLEWRALARALDTSGREHTEALRDALAFRLARYQTFPDAAENERLDVVREGLAQYTATVVAAASDEKARVSALAQLARAAEQPTFIISSAYTIGVAYGILLDAWSPGWTRGVDASIDLAQLLKAAANLEPTEDAVVAAMRYDSFLELRAAEEDREVEQQARLAELRHRFVEGPVVVVPRGSGASFITTGSTPIPGTGRTLASYRLTSEWGSLEAAIVLVSADGETLRVPGPPNVDDTTVTGDGWTVTLAPGWVVRPGPRRGDFQVVRGER